MLPRIFGGGEGSFPALPRPIASLRSLLDIVRRAVKVVVVIATTTKTKYSFWALEIQWTKFIYIADLRSKALDNVSIL